MLNTSLDSNIGTCALCLQQKTLRLSHIAPKFASDWIKETSVTGFMRSYKQPNRRLQDGFKKRLLCNDCEQILSVTAEKEFAERFFQPYLNGEKIVVSYDQFLKKFAVSLAFRTAAFYDFSSEGGKHYNRALSRAMVEWRAFLLGNISNDSYEHHMLPLDYLASSNRPVPEKLGDYMMRSIAYDIIYLPKGNYLAVYTKLPGFMFISIIMPKRDPDFNGTKIHIKGAFPLNVPVRYTVPEWLQYYWHRKSREIGANRPSEGQMSKLISEVEKIADTDPEAFLKSGSVKAHENIMSMKRRGLIESSDYEPEDGHGDED